MNSALPIPFVVSSDAQAGPEKAHPDDAAFDLRAAHDVYLAPGDRGLVKTGVRVAIPEGFAGLVLPRSGLALKHGITVLNAPGLIDPGYRGEIGVILYNAPSWHAIREPNHVTAIDGESFTANRGDRIAQLLIVRTADVRFVLSASLEESERSEGGFGSTGR